MIEFEAVDADRAGVVLRLLDRQHVDDRRRRRRRVARVAGPGIIGVRVEQAGAIEARNRRGRAARIDRRSGRELLDPRGVEIAASHQRPAPRLLPRKLGARREAVLDRAGLETAEQVGLVDDARVIAVARVGTAPHPPARGRRIGGIGAEHVALAVVGQQEAVFLIVAREVRGVAQRHRAEIMLGAYRRLKRLGVAEVAVGEAVEGRAIDIAGDPADRRYAPQHRLGVGRAERRVAHRRRADIEVGQPAIGQLVALEVIEARRQPSRRSEPDGDRGRDPPALLPDRIAPGDILIVPHASDPHRHRVAQHVVHVERGALVVRGAEAGGARGEIARDRQLRDDVDRSARAAPPAQRRIRTADDLDLIDVEDLAAL